MAVEFTLPELGENVEKGDVVRVLVAVGDVVGKDQPLLELETDKATIEVPSNVSGTVTEIRVKAGDKVSPGQSVLLVDADGDGGAAPARDAPKAEAGGQTEGAPPEAAKAAPPRRGEAPKDAAQKEPTAARQDESRKRDKADNSRQAAGEPTTPPGPASEVPAAPSVRRYARELGVAIGDVPGTGPGGRIGQDDVKGHVRNVLAGPGSGMRGAAGPLPDFSRWGEVEARPMSNIRRKTAQHLTAAWQAPHVTQHEKADITALEAFRTAYGERVEKAGGKLTVTAIFIKIAALAIDRFPQFASSADMANEAIVYKHYRHIGVAVDTPNGLLVPVIRDADRKTLTEIAVELGEVSQKARDRKLSLDDMSGGVFSISNLGGIGGSHFTPIINQPEVAILGVSRSTIEPVWRDGEFVPREMLPLSLSYDHRVIDGADAARFIRFIAEAVERPLSMYV
jgi:pyruvate dehydrogenase E2 component (dihydrolipoamide acetyltransferase)